MSGESSPLDVRVEQLTHEVRSLSARVDDLARRLAGAGDDASDRTASQAAIEHEFPAGGRGGELSGVTVLAGVAEVCFLMVVALTLRTLVDNRIIDQPIGAVAGLVYAGLVVLYGFYRARSKRRYASLTVVCGMALVLAIVLETHFRFGLLPADAAYGIFGGTLLVMLAGGLAFGACGPLNAAVPAVSLAAMSMNFPDPDFVYLGCVIAVATAAAYLVTNDPRARWLVWCTFALSAFFWMWWTLKLRIPLSRHEELLPTVREAWFLPCLAAFTALYVGQTWFAAARRGRPVGAFESVAPGIAAAGAYAAARAVLTAEGGSTYSLGWTGAAVAAAFLASALWFAGRGETPRRAATWLSAAALLVLAVAVPDIAPNIFAALAVWTFAAVAVGLYGRDRLDSPAAFAAIAMHVVACAVGAWRGAYRVQPASLAFAAAVLLALALVCAYYYASARRETPGAGNGAPAVRAAARVVAIVVFWVGLVYAFGAARIVLYASLARVGDGALYAFECGQSMLINAGALSLAAIALSRRRQDLLATAAVVAGIGAVKVFAFDLLRTQGVPLVLDVLAFGLTTTAGSLIWGRWQRAATPEDAAGTPLAP